MLVMGPSLSTMWAQQARFASDVTGFARAARDAGYTAIEVSHSTNQARLEELLRDPVLPVRSLHAPAPFMSSRRGGGNSGLNLAAVDEDERAEAIEHTLRTIRYAADAGAHHVVVHLGGISRTLLPEESTLRRLYNAGQIDSDEAHAARASAHRRRAEAAPLHIDAARRSLAHLVEAAAAVDVAIGLENRLHFHEIPSPDETDTLLADYPPARAGYWHDVGHAEVQSRLGLLDARTALARLAPRLIGAHLHDVRGIVDHRAPGNGDVEWRYIAAALRPETVRTLEIDQREPEDLLPAAIAFLQARDVLPRE